MRQHQTMMIRFQGRQLSKVATNQPFPFLFTWKRVRSSLDERNPMKTFMTKSQIIPSLITLNSDDSQQLNLICGAKEEPLQVEFALKRIRMRIISRRFSYISTHTQVSINHSNDLETTTSTNRQAVIALAVTGEMVVAAADITHLTNNLVIIAVLRQQS